MSQGDAFPERIKKAGKDAEALLALGKAAFLAERYGDAVEAYRGCIALDGRNTAALYNLGVACQALGKFRDARKAFLQVLEIDPNYRAAQESLNSLASY